MLDYLFPILLLIYAFMTIWYLKTPKHKNMSGDIIKEQEEYKESLPGQIDTVLREIKNFWKR